MATETATTPHVSSRPSPGANTWRACVMGARFWIYGERVKDVTAHPAFRNAARMIAGCTMPA